MSDEQLTIVFNGYVTESTGYGVASRAYLHALTAAAIDVSVVDRKPNCRPGIPDPLVVANMHRRLIPMLYICHTSPPDIVSLKKLYSKLILITTWEADQLPEEWVRALNGILEVWVPCTYNLKVFKKHLKVPVFRLPHPVRTPLASLTDAEDNSPFIIGEKDFVVLSVCSWQQRKNPLGVIEAFLKAFPYTANVVLLLKTTFQFVEEILVQDQITELIKRLEPERAKQVRSRVQISGEWLSEKGIDTLMRRANCYISLHRSEGWCYPLFDAACNGTPVIATAYSGPTDYLDGRSHFLVPYKLRHIQVDRECSRFYFTSDMFWAEPDLVQAALLLKHVYEHYGHAVLQAQKAAVRLRLKYSPAAVGKRARHRLESIINSHAHE